MKKYWLKIIGEKREYTASKATLSVEDGYYVFYNREDEAIGYFPIAMTIIDRIEKVTESEKESQEESPRERVDHHVEDIT